MSGDVEIARLRQEIAKCTRILNQIGIMDYSGHVSSRLPDGSGLLIQPYDVSRSSLTPDDLMVCDMSGRPVGNGNPPREVFIHTEILTARPDVNAVAHFHPEVATMFTLVEDRPLVSVRNHAARWSDGVPVHPDPGHINSPGSGRALARTLGTRNAALIRAHGVVITAESVPAVLVDSVHFEENAQALFRAASLGSVNPLSPEEAREFLRRFDRPAHVAKLWKYYVGQLAGEVEWSG